MSASIAQALAPIVDSTSAIESAFLQAGEGLSRGRSAFEALDKGLSDLGTELETGASGSASASLEALSRTIVTIAGRLPEDARALAELVEGNQGITARFAILSDNMRMITIISRSARIEAVAFDDERLGLDSFTRAISQQMSGVQRDIQSCAAEHAKLTAMLGEAALTQTSFETTFGGKLLALAGELGNAADVIRRRRQDGSTLIRDVSARSVRITQATGSALLSLQVGDSIRQRLEHVAHAVTTAVELAGPRLSASDAAKRATGSALCRLGAAQLSDTAACLDAEANDILEALGVLADETREIVSVGAGSSGRRTDESESFITEFRSRFATARDLVQTCEETRQTVERAITELRAMLETLAATIATLGGTSRELVLVGMNVGLKAARLGPEGRSLVVVAEELKRLAGDISLHAHELLPVFQRVQQVSHHFDRDGRDAARQLDSAFQAIIDGLDRGDAQVADRLRLLVETGRDFATALAGAHRSFEDVVGTKRALDGATDLLTLAADQTVPATEEAAGAAERVDAIMMPLYTVVQERDVHAVVAASLVATAVARTPLAA